MRYILLTFGFLGWAFYELSGGSDFERQAERQPIFAPVPETTVTRISSEPGTIVPTVSSRQSNDSDLVVKASLTEDAAPAIKPLVEEAKAEELTQPETTETRVSVELEPQIEAPKDLRAVTGNRVNMRTGPGTTFSVVTKLSKGAEVEVIGSEGDGWLQLRVVDTGQVGYMADWLVTAAVN